MLDYAVNRFYDCNQGRFSQTDPLGLGSAGASPQSLNLYSYVSNDPVNFTDPDGLVRCGDISVFQTGRTVEQTLLDHTDTAKLARFVWHEGGTLLANGNNSNTFRLSQALVAQAIMNRVAVANGQVAVFAEDGNAYWGDGDPARGILRASILGYGSRGTTVPQELYIAASGAVDPGGAVIPSQTGELNTYSYNELRKVLSVDQGDPFRNLPGRVAIYNPEARRDMYVTPECFAAISAMQETNNIWSNRNALNTPTYFVTSWKTDQPQNTNPDSTRLFEFGSRGTGNKFYGFRSYILGQYQYPSPNPRVIGTPREPIRRDIIGRGIE